jgi:C4-type Zn-finger protein
VATKERLAAMAASLCAVCSGAMVLKLVKADPNNGAVEFRTYVCATCGHSQTYSVTGGDS